MTVATLPRFLTLSKAADTAGISLSTLRREIARGHLAARRIGRCVRVSDEELARWIRDPNPSTEGASQ